MTDTPPACAEMQLMIQADLDGELDAAATAVLAAHVQDCPACQALQHSLVTLSTQLRTTLRPEPAPASLRRALEARLLPPAPPPRRQRRAVPLSFAAGFAVAAALAWLFVAPPAADPDAALLASHLRALQPGHLTDVLSSDQHTVKPWFDGRIDYAPPVRDFAAAGFPLVGGRLDYLAGRPVAVLVYRRGGHLIDLYVWPGGGAGGSTAHDGYNIVRWAQDGMRFQAVSDVEAGQLAAFAGLWQRPP